MKVLEAQLSEEEQTATKYVMDLQEILYLTSDYTEIPKMKRIN